MNKKLIQNNDSSYFQISFY